MYVISFNDYFFSGYWYSFIYNLGNMSIKKKLVNIAAVQIMQIRNKFSYTSISF